MKNFFLILVSFFISVNVFSEEGMPKKIRIQVSPGSYMTAIVDEFEWENFVLEKPPTYDAHDYVYESNVFPFLKIGEVTYRLVSGRVYFLKKSGNFNLKKNIERENIKEMWLNYKNDSSFLYLNFFHDYLEGQSEWIKSQWGISATGALVLERY